MVTNLLYQKLMW